MRNYSSTAAASLRILDLAERCLKTYMLMVRYVNGYTIRHQKLLLKKATKCAIFTFHGTCVIKYVLM